MSSESRDTGAIGSSTAICQYGGPYKCSTHPDVIVSFSKGQKFTSCPMPTDATKSAAAGHTANWIMVRETDADAAHTKIQSGNAL